MREAAGVKPDTERTRSGWPGAVAGKEVRGWLVADWRGSQKKDANEAPWAARGAGSAQEFVGGEGHLALLVAMGVVPPAKSNLAVLEGDQPMVGDGHAMGVTGQVMQDIFGTAERRLGINHPILTEQGTHQSAEQLRIAKRRLVSVKSELPLRESPPEARHKLASKHPAEDLHR